MYLELLASGVVGVFLDYPWVRDLLPGYKLMAKDQDTAADMLHYVYSNYEKCRQYVIDEIRPFIEQNRSSAAFCAGVYDVLELYRKDQNDGRD